MAVNLSPLGGAGAQFFSNNGVPLAGGLLYTYLAGTSTPATAYTSSNGITALANPIILDAAGRVPTGEIWLSDGISYKFVLKDATDALIATWDNLSGINSNFIAYTAQEETVTATAGQTVFNLSIAYIPATNNLAVFVNGSNQIVGVNYLETDTDTVTFLTGLNVGDVVKFSTATPVATNVTNAANVAYNPAGTGAVATSVQTKLREFISPQDYGAVTYTGTYSGQADASGAINDAIDACPPGGEVVLSGKYFISSPILFNKAGITLRGGTLEVDQAYAGAIIEVQPPSGKNIVGSVISDIRFQTIGRDSANPVDWPGAFTAIQFKTAERAVFGCSFTDLVIDYATIGLLWNQTTASPSVTAGFTTSCNFNNIKMFGTGNAFYLRESTGTYAGQFLGNQISDCIFSSAVGALFKTDVASEMEVNNCVYFADTVVQPILFDAASASAKLSINGGYWEFYPYNFIEYPNIATSNIRIVVPNYVPGNPGYTTTLPNFSESDTRTNRIDRDIASWTASGTATLTPNTGWYQGSPYSTFAVGASAGVIAYNIPNASNYSKACSCVFSVRLKSSAVQPFSVYATVYYSDSSTETFVSQQGPDSVGFFNPIAVKFKTHVTKTVTGIGLIVQGANNETALVGSPMFTVGTSIPLYPEPVQNPNVLENWNNTEYLIQGTNYGSTSPAGYRAYYPNVTAGAGGDFFVGQDVGAVRVKILGSGNIQNVNNSYGAISDQALKENIADAAPKLADLNKVKVRNFNLISDETKAKQIGVIAQELEDVFPGMVETDADGLKSVKYSVFVPMLIKAVQELSAKVKALEAK